MYPQAFEVLVAKTPRHSEAGDLAQNAWVQGLGP